ncbi:MAG: PKD domain-containing protein [candidate division KSB1 bacterium]|nr:PKD domain-containing protein [candidate division KSB1 bacterium]
MRHPKWQFRGRHNWDLAWFLIGLGLVLSQFVAASNAQESAKGLPYASSVIGEASNDLAGWDVAFVGDVNQDGYEDVLIGAPQNSKGGLRAGAAYLIFGSAEMPMPLTSITKANVTFLGSKARDEAGMKVSGVGDVNGDGISDFIIAAPMENGGTGKIYLFFGKKEGWTSLIQLDHADVVFSGEKLDDNAGLSVAGTGDVNGDGIGDILIGAPRSDSNGSDAGRAYLVFGKKSSWARTIGLAQADIIFDSEAPLDLFGWSVSGIGDVNGDGLADFAIGAPNHDERDKKDAGKVYVFFGRPDLGGRIPSSMANATFTGFSPNDMLGKNVSNGGDINGDGLGDFAVTAPLRDSSGKIYLVLGRSSSWAENMVLEGTAASFLGEKVNDNAGVSIVLAELNGDEFADILVGASLNSQNGDQAGKVYFIPGKSSGWDQNVSLATAEVLMIGEKPKDNAGHALAVGDFDRDGAKDVMASAPGSDASATDAGIIYFFRCPFKPIPTTITIISPNGGENWLVGSTQMIRWSSTGNIPLVNLSYSADNGANWKLIASSTPNTGNYAWVIPNDPSPLCRVKVEDAKDGHPADQSDQPFAIIAPVIESIHVNSPNGGEQWLVGTQQQIRWEWTGSIPEVKIEYSINGGLSWLTIEPAAVNDGAYDWIVPNTPSATCLVKISDKADGQPCDISDAFFAIVAPIEMITVISPNGGECLRSGSDYEIKWNSAGPIAQVKIEYSIDGGSHWISITDATANDGSFFWNVPNVFSKNAFIKISDVDGLPQDVSDHPFTIWNKPLVTVISPNGGECIKAGQIWEIKWEACCCLDSVKIQYSIDGGQDWTMIVFGTENDGSFIWTVPQVHSTNCLIKVADLDCDPEDISDHPFTIWGKPPITVISPNGGECLCPGQKFEIKWSASCEFDSLKIQFSADGGEDWNMIVYGTPNDGSYLWTVPEIHSTNCLIKVADLDCNPEDISDRPFTIWNKPAVTVVTPNGGECLQAGQKYEIRWEASCKIDSVKIQFSRDGGKDWSMIAFGTPNDGSYLWTVPDVHSTNCFIKVADLDCDPFDISDHPFTIWNKAPITVIAPNGGECLRAGDQFEIKWEAACYLDSLKIQYSTDNGTTWVNIVSSTNNDGSYLWTVPTVNSKQCRIKVADRDCDPFDVSDQAFTICAPPFVKVLQPNGGERLQIGSSYTIRWHACCFIDSVKLQLSIDNGRTWQNIVARTENDSSYQWTVPNTPSDSCRIKVADLDCDPFDISDAVFSITRAPVWQVVQPNGGEQLQAGSDYEIKWLSSGYLVDTVKIQYSIDAGKNWLTIIHRTENDGSYLWKVPNALSDSCLVKVADVDCDPFDVSDAFFKIRSGAVAHFDASIMSGAAPLEVKFINLSSETATAWRWNFGDGTSSNEASPTHVYSIPGNYTVQLIAHFASKIDTAMKIDFIRVHEPTSFAQLQIAEAPATLPQNDCSKATDGDLSGWDGTAVLTGNQPAITFAVNTTTSRAIKAIGLISDTGIGYETRWIRRFLIAISSTGTNASDFRTVLDTTLATGAYERFELTPISAKYVKLQVLEPQSGPIHLGEFEVFLTDASTTGEPQTATNPKDFVLAQNYPNPFNPTTAIRFQLPQSSVVKLEIVNLLGETIRTLIHERREAGSYEVIWDGKDQNGMTLPSGIYLYVLTTPEYRAMRKMVLAK